MQKKNDNEDNFTEQNGVSVHKDMLPPILTKSIDNIIKKEGYITCNFNNKIISTNGGSYLGTLYEVKLKGKTAKGNKETNIFIKHIIPQKQEDIFSVTEAYFKESFFYKEITKVFMKLQDEAEVPNEDRLKMVKSFDDTNTELICLENMAVDGYKTLNRMDVLPLKFAELSIKQLASFHGLSLVLKIKQPEYFDKNLKVFKQFFSCNDDWRAFVKNMVEQSCQNLNEECKKKVMDFLPSYWAKFPLYMEDSSMPGCTICHGDYRQNNVLMREVNGEITEVVPVDYQLLYYGNPINDFLYFIFTASDREFRKNHLENLKNLYYISLEKFLKYFNLDLQSFYPRNEFERQYKERFDYGLMMALFSAPFCFTVEDQVPMIGEQKMKAVTFVLDRRIDERIQGVVDDYIQWGYL
ncbi:uncharacterized protein LOC126372507 [Pectinophora gossypiella]|uniref:uncharacterized protein LOC126372507 n=1 Tax=Pectinophora gossypiella TaxID=13191 RepID=UPI00214E1747|nr:uncharacterized protein LOC126372507 [Pectinophora gossypiella]